jgi:hypothetical protein
VVPPLPLAVRHGVSVTPSMAKGKAEEGALRKRLAAALGGGLKPVYIDGGWARGAVNAGAGEIRRVRGDQDGRPEAGAQVASLRRDI